MGAGTPRGAVSTEIDRGRTAVVFPGQSSGDDVARRAMLEEWRPELLATLADALGHDEPLALTEASLAADQAATVGASLASWHARGCPTPRFMVGHSLGELTALAAARAISEDDAVRLAAIRGELIQRACDASAGCGMVAVRAPLFDIEAIVEECDVAVAFHDAPRQVVVAGTHDALERARAALDDAGIRSTTLDERGAFNSPLMEPVVAPFRAALEQCEVHAPQAIVYSAATCRPLIDVRAELARSVALPVRWWETLARLAMEGIESFVEISVGGLIVPLPAGIVSERAAPGGSRSDAESVFAYFDEESRLHVLV